MFRWSLMGDYLSLLILTIIFIRYYCFEARVAFTLKKKLFLGCLLMTAASTLLNIVTVVCVSAPIWLGMLINTGYFLFSGIACSLFAFFFFLLALEHVYDRHCMKLATMVLSILFGIYLLFIVANLFNGMLFYYDEQGLYQRGLLNRAVYLLPIFQLFFFGICCIRNRKSLGPSMIYILMSMPSLVVIMCLFQIFYPDFYMNGISFALVSIILFFSFQSFTGDLDSLTGIRNRNNFMTELSLRINGRQPIQVILVSLLSFSDINLRHGHKTGDALLYEIARYLDHLYPHSRAFRTSNLTFALILPRATAQIEEERLQTIQSRFQEPWVLGPLSVQISCCLAEISYDGSNITAAEFAEHLQYTLALAKREKRLVRFDDSLSYQMRHRQDLIELMQRALHEHRFQVWYQPIYSCSDGICNCAEALLRLNNYEGVSISPGVFIPLAEETGMIEDLTWVVLDQVCQLLSSTEESKIKSVSINLSMQQLQDLQLAEKIQQYLSRYQVSPSRLKIEITERFLLHDAQYAKRQLAALNAIGLQIYMDDFGTGYSNFANVLDYPFSIIKLDRSLTLHVLEDRRADLMVHTLLSLFHGMEKRVVVEGVETEELANYLKSCHADMLQGFYYARPMPKTDLLAFFNCDNHSS